jgi:thioredoxin-related protein
MKMVCELAELFNVTVDCLLYKNSTEIEYLLGIDGGGTKTEFLLTDRNRNAVRRIVLGGSNPVDVGMDNCQKILEEGISQICKGINLRAISAFAPPMTTQDWVLTPGASLPVTSHNSLVTSEYKTMTNHNGQITFTDYDEGMAYAKENNMPVFLDFNGFGCVNCRKMEAAVLNKPEVAEHMHKYVLISLIVDDKTKLEEPITVEEYGKNVTLKTVGDKWSYMQRSHYQSNAQPYYVQLDADGNRIVESSYAYDEDIQKFLNWLKY